MGSPLSTPSSQLRAKRGFALLITITLLAVIVLLLIGLAAYTRVETAVAGNTQRQAQARENALLALDVALGQLQKAAGPDRRVTATAENFGGASGTSHYTGVWDSTGTGTTPLTWLVSGNEALDSDGNPTPLAITPESTVNTTNAVSLVSTNTSRTANDVLARLMPVRATGIPGAPANTIIGRYAWWVGDQGVKAPVAIADATATTANYNYAPFAASADLRRRIRQQIGIGAAPIDASGNVTFEPRDTTGSPNNATLAANTAATNQLSFMKTSSGTVGLTALQQNYFSWSPNNAAVLASTNPNGSGLRRDLSRRSDLLGAAFAAWSNYSAYVEPTDAPLTPEPLQPYGSDPIRRRYRMVGRTVENGIEHRVAPVLSFFGLSFSLRNDTQNNTPSKMDVSARCVVGLWNPYSAALVPEDLELSVVGLPVVTINTTGGLTRVVPLQNAMENGAGEVKFALPFTPDDTNADRSSWLPGRVYNWSAPSSAGDPGSAGYSMSFYQRAAVQSGAGIVRDGGASLGPNTVPSNNQIVQNYRTVSVPVPQKLTITLRRPSTGETLAIFQSPQFESFQTTPGQVPVGAPGTDFAYVFRLPDSREMANGATGLWLQSAGRDPREYLLGTDSQEAFLAAGGNGPHPELLVAGNSAGFVASYSPLLLDRYTSDSGRDFNEDVPVFELPRMPLLSLGSLQHLLVSGEKPFAIGNSWGGARNAWFDSFFFSGLTPDVEWTDLAKPLPNPLLNVLRRNSDGSPLTAASIRDEAGVAEGFTSKFLLQNGTFNVNSASTAAWRAVLRGVRFPTTATNFLHLNVNSTGTTSVSSGDATTTVAEPFLAQSRIAAFPRFGQSAQETFEATDGYVQSDPDDTAINIINTPLFRRGIRFLDAAQVVSLADNIVTLVRQKLNDSGPYRTMEEFLGPSPLFVNSAGEQVSLLEKAIEDSQLNTATGMRLTDTVPEFSSQFLTQADVMTALAPFLFPRSDTFVIRTYGEVVNPATGAVEGRAWCEATVQRLPEYFDKTQAEETPPDQLNELNLLHGRRFKVVAFRWLTRSDI